MPGYTLKHSTIPTGLVLVPLMDKPLFIHHAPKVGKDECPTCQQIHLVKTVHLNFSEGKCIVSRGVLDHLLAEGLPPEITLGNEVPNPPNLTVDGERTRQEIDFDNNRQQYWNPGQILSGN